MLKNKQTISTFLSCILAVSTLSGCAGMPSDVETTVAETTISQPENRMEETGNTGLENGGAETDMNIKPDSQSLNRRYPGVQQALLEHDNYKDDIGRLNAKAEKREFGYWGTGLTAEEEKDMILGMNKRFKDAVLTYVMDNQMSYNYISLADDSYDLEKSLYEYAYEAADAGIFKKDDIDLWILSDALYSSFLYGELSETIIPKLYEFIKDKYPDHIRKQTTWRPSLEYSKSAGNMNFAASSALDGMVMEEADLVIEEPENVPDDLNTSEYNEIKENVFKSVKASPLSTFSIDVDTAGYTKVKYDILSGSMIDKDEVKIEELINYFNFDYSSDRVKDEPFIISTEYTACPWNKEHNLLRIGIKADDVQDKPHTNFVLVADVSGSMMSLNKLPLALNAYADMLEGFDENDTISLIYYASGEGVVLDGVSCDDKDAICRGFAEVLFSAGGGTNGEVGLNTAYKMAKANFIHDGVNRVLIATDGDFNIGRTSESAVKGIVEKGADDGVYLTILGYGFENLKDNKMEIMSENGHGNYHYIGDISDSAKALVDEAASTLIPVADDVKIQVEFNPGEVQEYRLIGYESRLLNAEDFNNDTVKASQIGAGKSVTALYEIVPVGAGQKSSVPDLRYSTATVVESDDICNVAVRYKGVNSAILGSSSNLVEHTVKADDFTDTPDANTALAISLAEFGMVLRDSEYKGTATLSSAEAIAKAVAEASDDSIIAAYADLIGTLKENSKK